MDVRKQVDAYELAMLAGGAKRCVDAALAGLVVAGRVRPCRGGPLAVVEPHATHPVEGAVLEALAVESPAAALRGDPEAVQARAAADPRVSAVRDALVRRGLLRPSRLGWLTSPESAYCPTTAGRRLLDSERRGDATGWDTARAVALLGAGGMCDATLREAVFGGAAGGGTARRRRHGFDSGWAAGIFGGGTSCGSHGGAAGSGGHSGCGGGSSCGGSSGCGGGGCGGS
jgi:hypothetical protein